MRSTTIAHEEATARLDAVEGELERARMEAGRLKLEGIKSEKLKSLQSAGVPAKYTVDLANKKFM